jgi:hypothetical protein
MIATIPDHSDTPNDVSQPYDRFANGRQPRPIANGNTSQPGSLFVAISTLCIHGITQRYDANCAVLLLSVIGHSRNVT